MKFFAGALRPRLAFQVIEHGSGDDRPTKVFCHLWRMVLLLAFGATAKTTNDLSDAEIQGRQLAQQILEQQPTENFTNTGVLKIRDATREDFVRFLFNFKPS